MILEKIVILTFYLGDEIPKEKPVQTEIMIPLFKCSNANKFKHPRKKKFTMDPNELFKIIQTSKELFSSTRTFSKPKYKYKEID